MADELIKVAEDSARGGFFLVSGHALSTVIMAISSILIARFLGSELYGQYTLAIVVPQLLFLCTDLGINHGIVKFTASLRAQGETNRAARIIKYGLILRISMGIAIFVISYVFADLLASIFLQRPDLAFYLRIASIAVVFQVIYTSATSAFVGLDKTEYNALTQNIEAIAKAIISIGLVLVGFSVAGALLGYVAGFVAAAGVGSLILFLVLRKTLTTDNNHQDLADDMKTLMRYGTPLFISLLLTGLVPIYQSIILAMFTTDANIGNFKAALNFVTLVTVVTFPIQTALLPAFSKLNSLATHRTRAFFRLARKYTAMLILPIALLVIIFSSEMVQIIYGPTYQSAPLYLAMYCLLYLLVGLGFLTLTSFYNGLGETKTTLKMSLMTFILLAILAPILTKTSGVPGLIIAFLIANTAGTLYGSYIARTRYEIGFDTKPLIRIYVVSMLSGLLPLTLLQFSPLPKLFNVIAGAALYFFTYITLTPLVRIIDHSELKTATHILQRIKLLAPIISPVLKYQKSILDRNKPT